MAVTAEGEGGAQQVLGAILVVVDLGRRRGAVVAVEHRLGVEQVDVAGSAVHEELDHGPGGAGKRLGPLAERGRLAVAAGVGLDQAAQGQSGKAVAQARQDRSSREGLNEHG